MQRRSLALGLSLLLAAAVVGAIWKSRQPTAAGDNAIAFGTPACEPVKLLTGSAKFAFLQDPRVSAELAKQGLCPELSKSGNFKDDAARAGDFDAVWPAGANAANDFVQALNGKGAVSTHPVFASPLAIASWKPLLPVFQQNGLLDAASGEFLLDKALPLMLAGTRWNELRDNTVYAVNKGLLVNTPDIRKSNTGLLYIALLAWMKHKHEVPTTQEAAIGLASELSPLITRQGFQESTLAGPFEDYIGQGMGKAPLVLIYESQFVEATRQGKLRDKHVMLYPVRA
ncbi:hypothetical protein FNU76_12585 [Chitinimonas arctica]|uniref:ABC transporter substrate-binding protein n=1 Tax=Chitinimonas arctica TaxID=2594795 RepID=A0A516SG43_9NEIS|nr:hypothetical protein [Chitinimonas arctica]QDQ27131.1 hypothetical protein FNU76_12585 [Chitinimonas arctica]